MSKTNVFRRSTSTIGHISIVNGKCPCVDLHQGAFLEENSMCVWSSGCLFRPNCWIDGLARHLSARYLQPCYPTPAQVVLQAQDSNTHSHPKSRALLWTMGRIFDSDMMGCCSRWEHSIDWQLIPAINSIAMGHAHA